MFEVDGCSFELKRLNVDDACKGLEILARIQSAADQTQAQVQELSGLVKLFTPYAKVSRYPDGPTGRFETGGAMVDLKPFVNDAFSGKHRRLMQFAKAALESEFGDFLGVGADPEPPQPTTP